MRTKDITVTCEMNKPTGRRVIMIELQGKVISGYEWILVMFEKTTVMLKSL